MSRVDYRGINSAVIKEGESCPRLNKIDKEGICRRKHTYLPADGR